MNPEERGRAAVGSICRKGRFEAWNERVSGCMMEYQIIVSMTVVSVKSSEQPFYFSQLQLTKTGRFSYCLVLETVSFC